MSKEEKIESLFRKYSENECTQEEVKQLLSYFESGENESLLKHLIEKYLETGGAGANNDNLLNNVFRKLTAEIDTHDSAAVNDVESPPSRRSNWYKVSAAAAVLFLFSSVGYLAFNNKDSSQKKTHDTAVVGNRVTDIQPGTDNAFLTLDDGSTINLDKVNDGELVQLGNIVVSKSRGKITYRRVEGSPEAEKIVYSTVTTLRGNEYHLILEDGTGIWLNAESSVRFPVAFSGNERRVAITGEAYFEVAKMPSKPFLVDVQSAAGNGRIEVMGTHFNVSAYPDDAEVKTTLLEGSVKIMKSNKTKTLSPGEQARYSAEDMSVAKNVDVSEVMAWKEGLFIFNNTDIKAILKEVARWYDIEVLFEGDITAEGFTGKISKSLPLSKFLKVLEMNGIRTRLEGRKVIVE